jgi:glycosyltransferase involved in cell wall biosynthesis
LHLIGSLERGGTEHQLVEFVRRSSHPERHTVALFSSVGPLAAALPRPPVFLGTVSTRQPIRTAQMLGRLRRLVRRTRTDIVHAHLSLSELVAALGVPRGVPIIASRRGRTPGHEDAAWFRILQGMAHRRVALMICNSEELAAFTRTHDVWAPPIEVIRNGVDVDRFAVTPMPGGPPRIVVVGNLIGYKRHDLFLHALALLRRTMPDVEATLVGEGPERSHLEASASELGLDEGVDFMGQVADVRPHIASAHVLALTSAHEGLPNAVLEGMAMGRPIVATRVGGVPEVVRDGIEGHLVGHAPEDIADGLARVLSDASVQRRMGAAARSRAESFSWDRVVARTEAAYARAMEARTSRGRG